MRRWLSSPWPYRRDYAHFRFPPFTATIPFSFQRYNLVTRNFSTTRSNPMALWPLMRSLSTILSLSLIHFLFFILSFTHPTSYLPSIATVIDLPGTVLVFNELKGRRLCKETYWKKNVWYSSWRHQRTGKPVGFWLRRIEEAVRTFHIPSVCSSALHNFLGQKSKDHRLSLSFLFLFASSDMYIL